MWQRSSSKKVTVAILAQINTKQKKTTHVVLISIREKPFHFTDIKLHAHTHVCTACPQKIQTESIQLLVGGLSSTVQHTNKRTRGPTIHLRSQQFPFSCHHNPSLMQFDATQLRTHPCVLLGVVSLRQCNHLRILRMKSCTCQFLPHTPQYCLMYKQNVKQQNSFQIFHAKYTQMTSHKQTINIGSVFTVSAHETMPTRTSNITLTLNNGTWKLDRKDQLHDPPLVKKIPTNDRILICVSLADTKQLLHFPYE